MDETLKQLGELLLESIPTIILFLVVYFGYRIIVHKPLLRVLEERYAKTQGAIEKARADVAAAESKTAEYEQRLRESKLAVFKAQEARRQQAVAARTELLNQAREQAAAKVAEARSAIERDVQAAKASLQGDVEKLAADVINSVLRPVAVAGGAK
ncbi:MAG TPA: ATP synthase F0 subunit B [Terriglobales bacterium]|nr:ATP synthase F0 subunit B [Terriglobales bacterium]